MVPNLLWFKLHIWAFFKIWTSHEQLLLDMVVPIVDYFNQRLGAAHPKRWLK